MSPTGPALICFDGSESARTALTVTAPVLAGGRNLLLHVWNPPDSVLADSFSTRSAGPSQAVLESEAVSRSEEVVSSGRQLAHDLGLNLEVREERNRSSEWRTILEVADELDCWLIVAGTHGGTAVQDRPLGSVSDGLVHHSGRPVLIVPTGATR